LRRRARDQFRLALSGRGGLSGSPVLARYALFSLVWSVAAAIFIGGLSLRYLEPLSAAVPTSVAWALLAVLWLALFAPVFTWIGPPLRDRLRSQAA
jgi:hypothetical protein